MISSVREQREYDKFTENSGSATAINVVDGIEANYIMFDPDDVYPKFIGINKNSHASLADSDWVVLKFNYTGTATGTATQFIQKRKGVWNNRVTMDW